MKEQIFKAYDIRGDYPLQINEQLAYDLGRAFVTLLKSKKVLVGRDCRKGSKELSQALMRGITEQGAEAVDLGLCSTPVVNFASKDEDAIMITASHLPAHKNGFKLYKKGAIPLGESEGLQDLKNLVDKNKFAEPKNKGEITQADAIAQYVEQLSAFAKNLKKLKVVIDAGNATAAHVAPYLFNKLPCELVRLFFEIDSSFPNRNPNPLEEGSLNALSKKVVETKADLGAAYDADSDRIVFVDELGQLLQTDVAFALMAEQVLSRKKETIVYDLTCSKIVPETITAAKGIPAMTKVGHTVLQQIMRTKKAAIGGERSGHYFFKELEYTDSGDAALLQILLLLSKTNKKLSELAAPLRKYCNKQESIHTTNAKEFISAVEEKYKNEKMNKLDGVTIELSDCWFNLRPSNTEPIVRLTIEAKSKIVLEQKIKEIIALASKY